MDNLNEIATASPLSQARASFHATHCPACRSLKRDGHWFCIECWKKVPAPIQLALVQMKAGWVKKWMQAKEILQEKNG